jgi:hypothetical protein
MSGSDWRKFIGTRGPVIESEYCVSEAAIAHFLEFSENARAEYYGPERIAPPTMLQTAARLDPVWKPEVGEVEPYHLSLQLPLNEPNSIGLSVELEFGVSIRPGDRVHRQSTIADIIPKTLRLGDGFIIVEHIDYWNQSDEWLGRLINSAFRYGSNKADHI